MKPFHSGEIAVQTRAGVREEAAQIGRVISNKIQPVAVEFLRAQQIAIASSIAPDGTIWASLLAGKPGFFLALDDYTIQIDLSAQTTSADGGAISNQLINSLPKNLENNSQIGLLAIDLSKSSFHQYIRSRELICLSGCHFCVRHLLRISIS
ncbi:MAG: hypothetical protein MUE44_17155 [Oscillatoriaceae cyanobacterium Prado104]|jgi:hypothetical protein|nr:hypothetical protein [Oscillatoriaceae cyanobacterium Prado104]